MTIFLFLFLSLHLRKMEFAPCKNLHYSIDETFIAKDEIY